MDPSPLQRLADRFAVTLHGGVRVRVLAGGAAPRGTVAGRTPGPSPERLLHAVLELEPPGPGTVDLIQTDGRWRVRGGGALADPRFTQRLRNVLGNVL